MEFVRLKVFELNKLCQMECLSTKGKKIELIYRLNEKKMNKNINSTINSNNEIMQPNRWTLDTTVAKEMLTSALNKSTINHSKNIISLTTLKEAHIYCKMYNLTGQFSGPVIEKYIKYKYNMTKNNASSCTGDLNYNNINIEIKVSNGGKENNHFNFVQIRMNHDCEYLFSVYYLCKENLNTMGELFVFKLNKEQLKPLIVTYGGYAHGTITEHGPITTDSLNQEKNQYEYAIRPVYGDKCWIQFLQYRIDELQI